MSATNTLPRSDELVSECANAVATARREGRSEWSTACSVLSAVERVLGEDIYGGKYRWMVDAATTTALAGFAQLGDAAAEPTVAALAQLRKEARLDPKPVNYELLR